MSYAAIIDYEQGTLTDGEIVKLFSDLIKSGLAWQLQGHYGRMAMGLVKEGLLLENGEITEEGKAL